MEVITSPKSCAFPVELIVTKSILLSPPDANRPLVDEEQAVESCLADVKSPKSIAFPVVEIVM